MAFTSQLGTPRSFLANIILGFGSAVPPAKLPSVPRFPTGDRRLDRFTEAAANILNSLIRGGYLVQTGPQDWIINPNP